MASALIQSEDLDPVLPESVVHPAQTFEAEQYKFAVVAVATTGCNIHSDDVCQIAIGVTQDNSCEPTIWSHYCLPNQEFHPQTSDCNGFYKDDINGRLALTNVNYGPIPVKTHSKKTVMQSFRDDLRAIADGRPLIIILYKANFDLNFLFRLKYIDLNFLEELNIRFFDALLYIKSIKDIKLPGIPKLRQMTVFRYLSGETEEVVEDVPFEANIDVRTLHWIVFSSKLEISRQMLLDHSITAKDAYQHYRTTVKTFEILTEMRTQKLVKKKVGEEKGVISEYCGRKIASKGMTYRRLESLYKASGPEMFETMLRNQCNVTTRITSPVAEHFRLKTKCNRV